ncbi:PDZ domain protein [Aphelenchoides avenae]|nr:PDZ domain protein [Aphelenchus avenae]
MRWPRVVLPKCALPGSSADAWTGQPVLRAAVTCPVVGVPSAQIRLPSVRWRAACRITAYMHSPEASNDTRDHDTRHAEEEFIVPCGSNQPSISSRTGSIVSNGGNGERYTNGYARSKLIRAPHEVLMPPGSDEMATTTDVNWQLFSVTLTAGPGGFGIAISGGRDNPLVPGDPSIVVSDVIASGPAFGLVQLYDRIISANGVPLENADYATAVNIMKDAQQLNMMVKRRVPVPFIELEQRTLKFTLSKSRKKEDFGIVLGCKFYIKEITNEKLAEKDPGLKEGDIVLKVNGQSLDGVTLDEATRLLQRSREKLSLVVQRDVRRTGGGSRWPSQNTVYERLGSVSATPRHSPTPVHYGHSMNSDMIASTRKPSVEYSPGLKSSRFSDPATGTWFEYPPPQHQYPPQAYQHPAPFPVRPQYMAHPQPHQLHPHAQSASPTNNGYGATGFYEVQRSPGGSASALLPPRTSPQTQSMCSSPRGIPRNPSPIRDIRTIRFQKQGGSLGIRVIGGNQVGIFVSAVQESSPAAQHGLYVGDRLHAVNGYNMNGVTREEAVQYLLSLGEEVTIRLEHTLEEYNHVKNGQLGDNFYVRAHFAYQKRAKSELSFSQGDIFHVTDTLYGGTVGYWQVTKVYSANDTEIKSNEANGIIPNGQTAQIMAKQSRMDSSTLGRSIFRKRLQSRRTKSLTTNVEDDFLASPSGEQYEIPAYERVALKKPAFHRPVVLFGPLADVARQLLVSNFPLRFGTIDSDQVVKMAMIDTIMAANKHFLAPWNACSCLSTHPIVVLIDIDSRNRIRELRSKAGATTLSARKLMEQSSKVKKHHSHLLTATLDASKEDAWFDALRALVFHLQDRRVWMPERQTTLPIEDMLLFPMQNCNLESDGDSTKGDYGTYGGPLSPLQGEQRTLSDASSNHAAYGAAGTARNTSFYNAFSRNSPYNHSYRTAYSQAYTEPAGNAQVTDPQIARNNSSPAKGYYDVKQVLAENYPGTASDTEASRSRFSASPYNHPSLSVTPANPRASSVNTATSVSGVATTDANAKRDGLANRFQLDAPYIDDGQRSDDGGKNGQPSENGDALNGTSTLDASTDGPLVTEHVHGVADWKGISLTCPESGVELIIPENAIPYGHEQEIFVKVCKENAETPPLDRDRKEALMSPLVMCGPQGVRFAVPVELRLPHNPIASSGSHSGEPTSFSLRTGTGNNWKNIELLRPPTKDPKNNYVSVLVSHF